MHVQQPLAMAFAIVLVATLAPAGVAAQETPTPASDTCTTTAVHDAFRFDNSTIEAAQNGSATSTVRNTRVVLEENSVFVRLEAENPNGYCVEFDVQISTAVVASSELGTLQSLDENTTAEWHAVRDFEQGETFTRVTFELGPGENATFAPNKARIKQLEWLADAKTGGEGVLSKIGSYWPGSDDDLKQRTYTFGPDKHGSSIITVPLRDPDSDRRVEDWQAMYRVDGGAWQPIDTDASAPVYYRETGELVHFYFNDQGAEVEFTANPDTVDRAKYEYRSYTAGLDLLGDLFSGEWDPLQLGGGQIG